MQAVSVVCVIAFAALARGAWDIPAQAAMAGLCAFALLSAVYYRRNLRLGAASAAFFIFSAYLFARAFFADDFRREGFNEALNWASYAAIYFACLNLPAPGKDFFFASLSRIGAFLAAVFFAQKIFGPAPSDFSSWATLPKQNVFALVMLVSAASLVDFKKSRMTAVEWACCIAVWAAAMFAWTVSISLGFAALAAVMFYEAYPSKIKLWAPPVAASAVFILAVKFTLDPRVWDRAAWYFASLKMFASAPAFGTGLGSFAPLAAEFTAAHFKSIYAHSFYLGMLAETGIVGFALLAALFYFVFTRITDTRARAIFALAAVCGATDFVFDFPITPLIVFAAAGAGSAAIAGAGTKKNAVPAVAGLLRAFLAAVAIFIAASSCVKYSIWSRASDARRAAFAAFSSAPSE